MVPLPLPSAGTMEWRKVANESGLAAGGGEGKEEESREGVEEEEEERSKEGRLRCQRFEGKAYYSMS